MSYSIVVCMPIIIFNTRNMHNKIDNGKREGERVKERNKAKMKEKPTIMD